MCNNLCCWEISILPHAAKNCNFKVTSFKIQDMCNKDVLSEKFNLSKVVKHCNC